MRLDERHREELERRVPQVSAVEARVLQRMGAALLDVRDVDRVRDGSPSDAARLALDLDRSRERPDKQRPLVVLDDGGAHALSHAHTLLMRGYADVRAVRGGFAAWHAAGLPIERPRVP